VGIQPAPPAHVNVNNEKPWDQYISLGYWTDHAWVIWKWSC
jgi:hypothetical protein